MKALSQPRVLLPPGAGRLDDEDPLDSLCFQHLWKERTEPEQVPLRKRVKARDYLY